MISIFRGLEKTKAYIDSLGDEATDYQREVYEYIYSFCYSGKYSTYSKKDVFLKFELCDDIIIAVKLDMNVEGVRRVRSRLSNKVYEVLGRDILDLIENGGESALNEAKLRVKVAEGNFSSASMFPAEFVNMINSATLEDCSFDLDDCLPELVLLHWLSLPKMADILSNVDADRLSFLLRVINGQDSEYDLRVKVINFINSRDDVLEKVHGKRKIVYPPKRESVLEVLKSD